MKPSFDNELRIRFDNIDCVRPSGAPFPVVILDIIEILK